MVPLFFRSTDCDWVPMRPVMRPLFSNCRDEDVDMPDVCPWIRPLLVPLTAPWLAMPLKPAPRMTPLLFKVNRPSLVTPLALPVMDPSFINVPDGPIDTPALVLAVPPTTVVPY